MVICIIILTSVYAFLYVWRDLSFVPVMKMTYVSLLGFHPPKKSYFFEYFVPSFYKT